MQVVDFNFIVLPLGVMIGILILTILIIDSRKDIIEINELSVLSTNSLKRS